LNSQFYTNMCSCVKMAETTGISENTRRRYTHFDAPDGKLYELVEERTARES